MGGRPRWKRSCRRPGGCHPEGFVDPQLEHVTAGATEQEMFAIVVDTYQP